MGRRETPHGQAMVELALVLPIFVFILIAFFDLGRVILAHDALSHAAREAARLAIVHGGARTNPCPMGPPHEDTVVPTPSPSCQYPSPSTEEIRQEARDQAAALGGPVTVEVCYGTGCVGDTSTDTNQRGVPVTVTVRGTVSMVAGSLIGVSSFDVTSSSTMLVNH